MARSNRFLLGLIVGAGAMYLFDPDKGNRRRALLRDQMVSAGNQASDSATAKAKDLSNRAQGVAAEARGRMGSEQVSDAVLEARVRSEIGRVVSNAGAILVSAYEGRVTLRGPVLAKEVQELVRTVKGVRGVDSVDNQLNVHQQPGDVPSLQGTQG